MRTLVATSKTDCSTPTNFCQTERRKYFLNVYRIQQIYVDRAYKMSTFVTFLLHRALWNLYTVHSSKIHFLLNLEKFKFT